jgi:hypothetical protein
MSAGSRGIAEVRRWDPLRRDLSRLELAVVCAVLVVLLWVAIDRISAVAESAERAHVSATVDNLRAALMLRATTLLVRGDLDAIARLQSGNPIFAGAIAPPNYVGVLAAADVPSGERRIWFFDPLRRLLVYRFADYWIGGGSGARERAFRVRLLYDDRDGDGRFAPRRDGFRGISLESH